MNRRQNRKSWSRWETWWKAWLSLTINLFRAWLSDCFLTLIITNQWYFLKQTKRIDSDNQINISTLICYLVLTDCLMELINSIVIDKPLPLPTVFPRWRDVTETKTCVGLKSSIPSSVTLVFVCVCVYGCSVVRMVHCLFIITEKSRDRERKWDGVGVMKDKEMKLEEVKVP